MQVDSKSKPPFPRPTGPWWFDCPQGNLPQRGNNKRNGNSGSSVSSNNKPHKSGLDSSSSADDKKVFTDSKALHDTYNDLAAAAGIPNIPPLGFGGASDASPSSSDHASLRAEMGPESSSAHQDGDQHQPAESRRPTMTLAVAESESRATRIAIENGREPDVEVIDDDEEGEVSQAAAASSSSDGQRSLSLASSEQAAAASGGDRSSSTRQLVGLVLSACIAYCMLLA